MELRNVSTAEDMMRNEVRVLIEDGACALVPTYADPTPISDRAMNRWHGCLWVDSAPTRDGRVISPAVNECPKILPVLRDDQQVATLTTNGFLVDRGCHLSSGATDLAPGWYRIEADFICMRWELVVAVPGVYWTMTAGRLASVTIGHRPCWPEAAIVVERG